MKRHADETLPAVIGASGWGLLIFPQVPLHLRQEKVHVRCVSFLFALDVF